MMLAAGGQWQSVAVSEAAGHAHGSVRAERSGDYAFLLDRCVDLATLETAIAEGARLGVPAVQVLLARSWVSSAEYVAAFAAAHAQRIDSAVVAGGATRPINATAAGPIEVVRQLEETLASGERPLLLDRTALELAEPRTQRRRKEHVAATRLVRAVPELSAAGRVWTWQLIAVISVPGVVAGGMLVLPEATLVALTALAAVPFLFVVGLRVIALLVLLAGARGSTDGIGAGLARDESALPSYAVLVPLYGEADVLPGLVEAIAAIDYPAEKLDVVLILEEVDKQTQAAAAALELPGFMRVVVVPDGQPRTKPKALNFAALGISSDLVVVYDAEDLPDVDQLRRAAILFRRGGPSLACVQARLTIYNPRASWLSRQFALEYAALFEGLLPALSRLGLPIPLGGTSNHFRREALERLGGWDAHNVTEDADLGVRIARARLRVAVLASDTAEEAPARLGVWIRQRTRWQKGFMQTWAVHMRRPLRLLGELGPGGFIGVNAIIGGHVVSALLHPFCVGWLVVAAADGALFRPPQTGLDTALMAVALFNLAAGYLSALALAAVAVVRRGDGWLVWHLALTPLYWMLVSAAAWRALWQAARDPYGWEKTPHAPRGGSRGIGLRQ